MTLADPADLVQSQSHELRAGPNRQQRRKPELCATVSRFGTAQHELRVASFGRLCSGCAEIFFAKQQSIINNDGESADASALLNDYSVLLRTQGIFGFGFFNVFEAVVCAGNVV